MTNKDNTGAPQFSLVLPLYMMMSALLAGSIAYSVALFLSWWVAAPIGMALSISFCALVKTAVSSDKSASAAWRVAASLVAVLLFCVTMGLSFGTLYQRFFAQASALSYFNKTRQPVQRQLEAVHANAETAAQSFKAWSEYSKQKSSQESGGGGTCPAKSASLGKRGPIAMFREGEASIAEDMNAAVQGKVTAMGAQLTAAKASKPVDYAGVVRLTADLNAVTEMAEALARGAFVSATKETLQRQLDGTITWPNGEVFKCSDTARDELINRAMAALTSLEKSSAITPLEPAIDLSSPQGVAIRGILRAFNSVAMIGTFGAVGQFNDDPLMDAALAKGAINQENVGMILAALLEMMVVVFSLLADRMGTPIYAAQPTALMYAWEACAAAEQKTWLKLAHLVGIACSKAVANLLYAYPAEPGDQAAVAASKAPRPDAALELASEPTYPARELEWGLALTPYLFTMHDGDYVCLPAAYKPRESQAARALSYSGAAQLLTSDVKLDKVAVFNPSGVMRLQRLLPNARSTAWELYRLAPGFAQALRVQLLAPSVAPPTSALR